MSSPGPIAVAAPPGPAAQPVDHYADFAESIKGWLRLVWNDRIQLRAILSRQVGFSQASGVIYDKYNDPARRQPSKTDEDNFTKFVTMHGFWAQTGHLGNMADFFHNGKESGEYRVYVHVKTDDPTGHVLALADELIKLMGVCKGFKHFKITGPAMSPNRRDSVVAWLAAEADRDAVLQMLKKHSSHFGGYVVYGGHKEQDGLAWTQDPPANIESRSPELSSTRANERSTIRTIFTDIVIKHGLPADYKDALVELFKKAQKDVQLREDYETLIACGDALQKNYSFGSLLSNLICLGLVKATAGTEKDFADQTKAIFAKAQIDPKNPHILAPPTQAILSAQTAQSNIVQSGTLTGITNTFITQNGPLNIPPAQTKI